MADGTLTIANALGNGVADDKAIYAYVPAMIEYYLDEKPKLAQVPTWICAERAQRDYVLDNLADLVVKPIDGLGGGGVLIGPDASEKELAARRRELLAQPERFIAQELVELSTHPTFDGEGMYPHHVDLRAFVHLRGRVLTARSRRTSMPAALTRVASRGSRIVNSSFGGGSKDTWILIADDDWGRLEVMCGICGEIRFDGRSADVTAVSRMMRGDGVPRPRFGRSGGTWAGGVRAPAAVDHRLVRVRRPAHGRQRARADAGVQRLHLQLQGAARGAAGGRLPLLLDRRQRGDHQGVPQVGNGLRRAVQGHVRVRDRRPRLGRGDSRSRPVGHQAALHRRVAGQAAVRLVGARPARRR